MVLDIEWNTDDKKEILQLAACLLDERYNDIANYFSRMRPENMEDLSKEAQKLLHLKRKYLEKEKTFKEEWCHFTEWLKSYNQEWILVVWNNESIKVLEGHLKRLGYKKPYKQVLGLQDLTHNLSRSLESKDKKTQSFANSCKRYGIKIDKRFLHRSDKDAKWLSLLFRNFMITLESYSDQYVDYRTLYYRSKYGNRIHTTQCKNIRDNQYVKVYEDICSGIRKGYMPCKNCIKLNVEIVIDEGKNYVRDFSDYNEQDERFIERICKEYKYKYGYSYQLVNNKVFISTSVGSWYITLNGSEVGGIYHENYRPSKEGVTKRKFKQQYHKQEVNITSLQNALEYIHNHDIAYKKNRTKYSNATRLDKLLRQLEKERNERA